MMWQTLMHTLERRLHARDVEARRTYEFAWGLELLGADPNASDPLATLIEYNRTAIADSERFFGTAPLVLTDCELADDDGFKWLRFPSAINTPYPANNTVHARLFPGTGSRSAVIVSPQWNAQADSHIALCQGLNRFAGISALRLSLPYHDRRMPEGQTRADFMVSPNLGRTLQAVRQAVLDVRRAADWLYAQGYEQVGVVGSSIGSCVSWLAFIHDARLQAGVFNMVSSWFGDVVWRALTTSHIRRVLEAHLTLEQLRAAWSAISPSAYRVRLAQVRRPALLVSARHDLTFLPDLTQIFFDDCEAHGVPARKQLLACGHYTIGRTPFKYLDAWHIINFYRRLWRNT